MLCGTPVAPHIVVHPGVHFKAVEGDALLADSNLGQSRSNLAVKAVAVHAQIGGGVAEADQAGLDLHCLSPYVNRSNLFPDMADFRADNQSGLLIASLLLQGQCFFERSASMGGEPAG